MHANVASGFPRSFLCYLSEMLELDNSVNFLLIVLVYSTAVYFYLFVFCLALQAHQHTTQLGD